ncbi:unnamed protein product [Phytophthora fragariaefolia]|uniref:Unnamed protein product n=1 Tax=Phytophthora fragariaefolia TaxID=1490495 RepID=A0A9W6YQA5_9STRA|nr:unnamed protein product [Phytophthora fragariaefolia]
MARRNVLNGASAWEREEKANQQRGYAAQLQEQRERAAVAKTYHPPQGQDASEPSSPPAQSPGRVGSMPQKPVVDLQHQGAQISSPPKATAAEISPGAAVTESAHDNPACTATSYSSYGSYTPSFSSPPSVFESVFREPGIGARSITFYADLAALHRLTSEVCE